MICSYGCGLHLSKISALYHGSMERKSISTAPLLQPTRFLDALLLTAIFWHREDKMSVALKDTWEEVLGCNKVAALFRRKSQVDSNRSAWHSSSTGWIVPLWRQFENFKALPRINSIRQIRDVTFRPKVNIESWQLTDWNLAGSFLQISNWTGSPTFCICYTYFWWSWLIKMDWNLVLMKDGKECQLNMINALQISVLEMALSLWLWIYCGCCKTLQYTWVYHFHFLCCFFV